jgi:glycine cleavage system aminomethyltransferase T
MYQPAGYDDQDSLEAYWYLVNGVTLWNVGTERQAGITGPDALAFTNSLTPRDLTTCRIGCCCYTLVTSEEGSTPLIDFNAALAAPARDGCREASSDRLESLPR